ncbi:hypothetical protein NESM_000890200 [Novymonas esmeraldas]|uniref:Uncharacterized protein n=1 Tax=Novymonas esmeraldas TaxID=1808958 RepID=A0AAW0EZ95_9TRYP
MHRRPTASLHLHAVTAALLIGRRHQRSTSARPRTSTWQEKTDAVAARQRELQEEAERAAQRRARYTSGTRAAAAAAAQDVATSSSSSSAGAETSSPTSGPLTKPRGGFWRFIKGGDGGRKRMPLNPLMYLSKWGDKPAHDPDARASQRLLSAINGLNKVNRRRRTPMVVQLPDDLRQTIVARYAATRWYARLYAPFQSVTEPQLRWGIRLSNVVLVILICAFIVVMLASYYTEMDAVAHLSPEDQRDYAYMVRGMRYSDIYKVGAEVLRTEDPLEALPPAVRLHIVIDACRQRRWHEMDWDVELRKMHPGTPLEELDYLHVLYWTMVYIGGATGGGGVLFSNRVLDVREVRQGNSESTEERDRFVEMGPTALPATTQRTFF